MSLGASYFNVSFYGPQTTSSDAGRVFDLLRIMLHATLHASDKMDRSLLK